MVALGVWPQWASLDTSCCRKWRRATLTSCSCPRTWSCPPELQGRCLPSPTHTPARACGLSWAAPVLGHRPGPWICCLTVIPLWHRTLCPLWPAPVQPRGKESDPAMVTAGAGLAQPPHKADSCHVHAAPIVQSGKLRPQEVGSGLWGHIAQGRLWEGRVHTQHWLARLHATMEGSLVLGRLSLAESQARRAG